ncbi:MAG TPA: VOC family protein [Phycisphaerales bacterium]|nr:VOC family protein [Phycisphaerales bacterium]
MSVNTTVSPCPAFAVNRLVTFAHVADVEASLAFYSLLGFTPVHSMKDGSRRTFWARASSGAAEIMFAQASAPVDPRQQAVLFYMYTSDVAALRAHLVSEGVADGGAYCGQAGPNDGRRVVFNVARPHYMPAGELRVADPDGYCILVGQLQ